MNNVKKWIDSQDWYQKIKLSNGMITKGHVSVNNRLRYFEGISIEGKTFIDIGCNSGGYCLWAKKNGASRVYGIDIDKKRIEQAIKLKEIENLDIGFEVKSLFDLDLNQKYDIVFCISVLTEVEDVIEGLNIIKNIMNDLAFIELSLTNDKDLKIRKHKKGFSYSININKICEIFGSKFDVQLMGRGERYDMIRVKRIY